MVEKKVNSEREKISLAPYPKGFYLIEIETLETHKKFTQKLLKIE